MQKEGMDTGDYTLSCSCTVHREKEVQMTTGWRVNGKKSQQRVESFRWWKDWETIK